jgi:hypothetical protein
MVGMLADSLLNLEGPEELEGELGIGADCQLGLNVWLKP